MNERRNVAASGAIAVLSVLAGMLAVRQWLAGLFTDVGPDRAADMVLLAGVGACAGVMLLGLAFTAVLMIVRARHERETPAAADVIDAQAIPVEWTRALVNGPNSRTMLPRAQLLDLAGRAVKELRPQGIAPTQAALRTTFGISGGTASAVQGVLREWGVAIVSDGAPSEWV